MGVLAMFKFSAAEERTQILYRAFSRSGGRPRTYAGYVTPQEAQRLIDLGAAKVVDLRTAFEREYVGHVPGSLHVEWLPLGKTEPNPGFIDALRSVAEPKETLVFLCRSGKRSDTAATAAAAGGRLRLRAQRARRLRGRPGRTGPARQARRLAQGRPALGAGLTRRLLLDRAGHA